ncbi:branched-chain amino acid ABC transporter permease [Microtetraspora malaysiensis]|uniref:branched-chain amino acid ABC transporter permease n=1 Tax=Microtetraspora malaysiensis TaxID=161358 RepID=UPI003D8E113B
MSAPLLFVREHRTALVTGAVLVVFALAPLLGAGLYTIVVLTSVLAYALLAMSMNLVAGNTGLLTLCHAAYAGVGAYGSLLVAREVTHNGVIQLLVAVGAGAGVAALTGWIAVRASKTYFLMLSLAIGELLHILAVQWSSVTKGDNGLSAGAPIELVPGSPVALAGYVYWVALLVFVVFAGLVLLVVRSPFGSALQGIRDNEARMRGLGYPTSQYKYAVWIFSGGVAGAAGWIVTAQLPRFIAPSQMSFHIAGLMLLAVVIGGLGSMWGSCVAAAFIVLMTDVVSQDLGGQGPLLLGCVFVIAVYALPRGLAGIGRRQKRRGAAGGASSAAAGDQPTGEHDESDEKVTA